MLRDLIRLLRRTHKIFTFDEHKISLNGGVVTLPHVGKDRVFVGKNVVESQDRTPEEIRTVLTGSKSYMYMLVAPVGTDLQWCLGKVIPPNPHIVVSYDAIWESLSGKRDKHLKRIYTRIEVEEIKAAFENNVHVILARYCGSRVVRERFMNLAKRYGVRVAALLFREAPKREIPKALAQAAAAQFSWPTEDEGFDQVVELS